jgi:N-acetylmuramoyl-L-alanine amidase
VAAPDSTRVVFDVSGPVKHKLFSLNKPHRAVIDLKNATLKKNTTQPKALDKYLKGIRSGARNKNDLRIVLDLKKQIKYKIFQLQPNKHYGHRLVIDLFDVEIKQVKKEETRKEIKKETQQPAKLRDVIIAIDAGHGGDDPGAKGPSGVYEKNVVLKIAKNLAEVINKERGMRAVLIRKSDYYIKLRNRIEKAREYKADLFISIHADAFRDPKVRGSSVYVLSKKGASSEAAKWLAEKENSSDLIGGVSLENKDDLVASVLLDLSQTASLEASIDIADRILKGLRKIGKVHKRNVQSAPFAVLKSPDIPSILIETAFISNPIEEKKLTNSKHRKKMSNAILIGLKGYFRDFAPEDSLLSSRKHTIERGETLSTIAQLYRISPNILRKYNSLKGDLVRAGQTIIIPRNSGT